MPVNIYNKNGQYFTEDNKQVTPVNTTISEDPQYWTYRDEQGYTYEPHSLPTVEKQKDYDTTLSGYRQFLMDKLTGNTTYTPQQAEVKAWDPNNVDWSKTRSSQNPFVQAMSGTWLPIAGTALGAGAAPWMWANKAAATGGMLGGMLGGYGVDAVSKTLTGKDWGNLVAQNTPLTPEMAQWVNPGTWVGGAVGGVTPKTLDNTLGFKFQRNALNDYLRYKLSGQFRNKFIWNNNTGEYGYTNALKQEDIPGVNHIISEPNYTATENFIRTGDGSVAYHFNQGQGSVHLTPEEYKPFGELNMYPQRNGLQKNIILTSPKVDAIDAGLEDTEALAKLTNRIPKEDMRKFWSLVDQTSKPGSYISGDMGSMPLGGYMIQSKSPWQALKILLKNNADKNGTVFRSGLSPDSYLAIIKQGLRPNHSLRFSRNGFTKLNPSAVDNASLYNQWKEATTPEMKLQFVKDWNNQIYPESARINNDGMIEFLQPYIFIKKRGGKI